MQTFRKLPRQSPMAPAAMAKMTSVPTRNLVQKNPGGDGDVERFGALRERDRYAARRDGVQMRPDSGPFVPDDHGDHAARLDSVPRRRHRPLERLAVGGRGPQGHVVTPGPGDEPGVVECEQRVAEG